MTFHRGFLLTIELSLLAIDPSIEALPYWDMTLDAVGGKYHPDGEDPENYIFSDKFFGSCEYLNVPILLIKHVANRDLAC